MELKPNLITRAIIYNYEKKPVIINLLINTSHTKLRSIRYCTYNVFSYTGNGLSKSEIILK